ncbi:MAG: glycosyltransferase family 9 protein, partial [Planctomycetota bacterium]
MQNEALKYVTGNYVWLIDSDEVYKRQDLEKLREILKQDPSITQVNFIPDNFWKGLDYTFVSHKFFEEPHHYRRLFKYQPGALFTSHRPPTMLWPGSKKTTENMHLLDGKTTRQMGIVLYHYSYVLDKQAKQKIELYHRYGWGKNWNVDLLQWYNECFLKWTSANRRQIDAEYPIWTGDVNSHTLPFQGSHPQVMIDYILNRSVLNHGISDANHIMHHVVAAVEEIKNRFNSEPILAIETGTIRSYDENHVSTYHIAKALANSGRLISVDISTDSIRRSGNICYEATNIELVQSDSVQYLSKLQDHKFHFAFLDSVNDKDVIFEEFSLIVPMMEEHAILMVDDAGITGDGCSIDTTVAAQKGHRIWQFLTACGVHPSILDTPGGHGTQLKVVLTGDNLARIKQGLCSFDSRSVCHGSALDMPDAPNADYNNNKKKVLIVRSDSIGDFVIFGGAIPYYRKIYPNAHVAVVVAETVAELAEACPFIDEVITFNRPKICSQPEYAAEFISLIRQKKFDVAICPAFSRDKVSEYIAINSGAAEKITCSGDTANLPADIIEADNAHFTKVIPMSEGIALETFRNEEFLRELGVELDGAYRPAVWVTKADREAAQQLLSRRRIRQPIVVVPFAQLDIRNWPVRNWAKLVSMYADVPVIICGTEKDKQAADKIAEQANHPNIYNLCGLTTVRQLAALIAQSRLCIGGESAAAHFAAVANQPHVVVIGGGHFGRFMPYSSQTKLVYNRMDCFNCNWQCKHGRDIRCIGSISVAMVQRAVNEALGTIRQEPALDSGKLIAPREENTPGKSD